jgi:hypothetical protein
VLAGACLVAVLALTACLDRGDDQAGGYELAAALGPAGCNATSDSATTTGLKSAWDYWDSCGADVVSASAEGLPLPPWHGDRVVRWRKPAGSPNVYQKLNRTLTPANWPTSSDLSDRRSPADVSGSYVVYQYVPSGRFRLNPRHGWVILSLFKENYRDARGASRQDPSWGLGCNNFSGTVRCSLTPHTSPTFALSDYTDRWVRWEYRLYQGGKDKTGHHGRIELYADDTLLDTGYESQFHVGSAAYAPLDRTTGWVWAAGQYTSNQTTGGVPDYRDTDVTSYVGLSTLLPLR